MKKKYSHLRESERFAIEKMYCAGLLIRRIAEVLGRSPNTVSREIARNSVDGMYCAEKAEHKAYSFRWRAKSQCMKVAMDSFLIWFVE